MFAEHRVSQHETSYFDEGTFADVIAYIACRQFTFSSGCHKYRLKFRSGMKKWYLSVFYPRIWKRQRHFSVTSMTSAENVQGPGSSMEDIDAFSYSPSDSLLGRALHFARSFLQEASIFILHNAFVIAACTLYLYWFCNVMKMYEAIAIIRNWMQNSRQRPG